MKRTLLAILMISLVLCGCENPQTAETTAMVSEPTQQLVDDLFTQPKDPTVPTDLEEPRMQMEGISSFGYEDYLMDEAGAYYIYHGGEMCVPFRLVLQGLEEEGVGVILFLNGQPQPYHTDFNETDQFMHTIYPSDLTASIINLYFIPRSGSVGETSNMDFLLVPFPGQSSSDSTEGMRFLGLKRGVVSRLIYEADPPAMESIPVTERVQDWSAELQDLTSEEISLWSSDNYQTKVEALFSAEGMKDFGTKTDFDADDIRFSLELKGAPDAEYVLTVFVNDQPVSVSPDNIIHTSTENGQKLVVNITLDVSDLKDSFSVYAMLSPTVYRSEGWDDNFISDYFFFTR